MLFPYKKVFIIKKFVCLPSTDHINILVVKISKIDFVLIKTPQYFEGQYVRVCIFILLEKHENHSLSVYLKNRKILRCLN